MTMHNEKDSILILGGGFAGLFTALHLSQQGCKLPIKIVDRETRFIFKPMLYELMSGEAPVNRVWPRYEDLLSDRNITFILGDIDAIDLKREEVWLKDGLSYGYRYLVLALGDVTAYFNVPGAEKHTVSFRSAEDAISLAKRLRKQLQQAAQATTAEERSRLASVAIVGAGPSGVELAATLADLMPQWYEALSGDPSELSIKLLQRGDEILSGGATEQLRRTAKQALGKRRMPVTLQLNTSVKAVEAGRLVCQQGDESKTMDAGTIVWTAGSATHPLIQQLPIGGEERDRRGRLFVKPTLQLPSDPNVFAGGDCATTLDNPMPASAQVAYQQGKTIAHNLMALANEKPLEVADPNLRGTLLKLGIEESAVELFDKFEIKGHIGHLIREGTYLSLLPTPAHNLKIGTEWVTEEIFEQVVGV